MANILDDVMNLIPDKSLISDSAFEGANIILYTKNKEFFLEGGNVIKDIVSTIKKRVELRPDPSIALDQEKAEELIRKILPQDAGVGEILFEPQRSLVFVEAEKPGLVIGQGGDLLKDIRKQTLWVPFIRRTPPIKSKIIENVQSVLYENNDYRRKFLHQVGERIYGGWKRGSKEDWIRITSLGASRQVGRSCFLLQTPESNIMLDCGIDVGSLGSDMFPYLTAPEFDIHQLDAVIISHCHIDHIGLLPYLFKMAYRGPCYMTAPTRDIGALMMLDMISLSQKEAKKELYGSKDIREFVKHTIIVGWEEVTDITPDVRLTFYNAGHILGSSLVHLNIGNGMHNFMYTGDLKYARTN